MPRKGETAHVTRAVRCLKPFLKALQGEIGSQVSQKEPD